jgi:hypothetical protein
LWLQLFWSEDDYSIRESWGKAFPGDSAKRVMRELWVKKLNGKPKGNQGASDLVGRRDSLEKKLEQVPEDSFATPQANGQQKRKAVGKQHLRLSISNPAKWQSILEELCAGGFGKRCERTRGSPRGRQT